MIQTPLSIIERVISEGEMTPAEAKRFISWKLSLRDHERVSDLMAQNSAGTISPADRDELQAYVEAGDILGAIQARARQVVNEIEHSGDNA